MRRSDLFIASQDDIDANKEEAMDTNTVIVNIENNSSAQVEAEDQGTNAAGDREMKLFISTAAELRQRDEAFDIDKFRKDNPQVGKLDAPLGEQDIEEAKQNVEDLMTGVVAPEVE